MDENSLLIPVAMKIIMNQAMQEQKQMKHWSTQYLDFQMHIRKFVEAREDNKSTSRTNRK